MTKELLQKFRAEAGDNHILMIETDNQHIFYDNVKDSFPIIWDDTNETFTAILNNQDQTNPQNFPWMKVTVLYEDIQFVNIFITSEDATKFVKDNVTDENKLKKSLQLISANRQSSFKRKYY